LGLDGQSFLSKQKSMDSGLVETISRDLIGFDVPHVSLIIAGIDQDWAKVPHPHIFTIYDEQIRCDDIVGFAAVGSGSHHAESLFMLGGHGWNSPLPETLLRTYSAKKASEMAPGVGKETDIIAIGPTLGQSIQINERVMRKLESEYQKAKARERKAQKRANDEVKRYVEELGKEAAAPQAQPSKLEGESASSDGEKSA
jgi:hypothetical protein